MAALHNRISRKELKERIKNDPTARITISFYCYFKIEDPHVFRNELYCQLKDIGVLGRIYVASEGINAQISLPTANLETFRAYLYSIKPLNGLRLNVAVDDDGKSFYVLDIKVRNKIVADGITDPDFDMANRGRYVNAEQFNQLTKDPDTIVIDMRNHYEFEVGHFENAIEIPSDTFREQLPMAVDMMKENKEKNIIMYCTGGIRCEKASAYMKHSGFKNVFHLEGGIINYVNEAKEKKLDLKFHGKNFVFDQRLGERVTEEIISQCHQCGKPADTHVNCVNDACHLLFIQCDECKQKYENTCSKECQDFIHLPQEEQKKLRSGIDKGRNVFNKSKQRKERLNSLLKPGTLKSFFLLLITSFFIQVSYSQSTSVTISGAIKNKTDKTALAYVTVILKKEKDSSFVTGSISNEEGRFSLTGIRPENYVLQLSYTGFSSKIQPVLVGSLSPYLDLGTIDLQPDDKTLQDVTVTAKLEDISNKMDKKSYSVSSNITQGGGSVLQALKNLPGVTTSQDGKVELRGSDKVAVLIDGKQTALTGFGAQTGLDNIPASAIERIEIINNPSAKYDANGNAGIINIIYKKSKQQGFNGKVGFATGLGALWEKKENLPTIRPQYKTTPKVNPSLSLNYRKDKVNTFLQADWLYTETLNKNEFVTRTYNNGTVIHQQTKRNRNTHFLTTKAGIDWNINGNDILTVSGLLGKEKIIDRGDEPFFNGDLSKRERLWRFLEDELKTTVIASAAYQHKFKQAGHLLNASFNYTFHREDEKYFFENILPAYTGLDSFALISDEHVSDLAVDYVKPLKHGRLEAGFKFRYRDIPTNMKFKPGFNSPLDTNAGGAATYSEIIPAVYGNYIYESKKIEAEIGLRIEYVDLQYKVNPDHNTYKSDGYSYTRPFPNVRLGYKIDDRNKISVFYNRRVDRPNEVDIRIFPKYDDAEIIKVGNPALKPQFTNTYEIGYKNNFAKGYFYAAVYHRSTDGTIIRIATQVPPSTLIYTVFQNAGHSSNTGVEIVWQQEFSKIFSFNTNVNVYRNTIDAFTVENKYPAPSVYTAGKETFTSGNIKLNSIFHLPKQTDLQVTIIYLAPDIIPQGKIGTRFSADMGIKRSIQKGKGEMFFNATDIFNTLRFEKEINGIGFKLVGTDYYETQVIRVGYNYKF